MAEHNEGALRSVFRDDPDMAELIELFVAEIPERVRLLEDLTAKGDSEGLRRLAHQLRGASGGYGFEALGQRAANLEAALKAESDVDIVRQRVDELIQICSRIAA